MTYPEDLYPVRYQPSPKSRGVALGLAVVLGWFGAHRFYAGRIGSGIAQLCTLGGLGLWTIYDIIMIGAGNFRDDSGRRLLNWDPTDFDDPYESIPPAVAAELTALRSELDEVHQRLDFAERMLARLPAPAGDDRA